MSGYSVPSQEYHYESFAELASWISEDAEESQTSVSYFNHRNTF
jgi:hypothetical protein